jgi:sulfopyruvate decarboxylase subunit alpha
MTDTLAQRFMDALTSAGYNFFTGVPCSLLAELWLQLECLPPDVYVPAVREDCALGMAAGAWLGGRCPCVLMQNSGLGTCMNALVSLHQLYELPALLVVSWRGEGGLAGVPAGCGSQAGFVDAPEHLRTGESLASYFELATVPHWVLDPATFGQQIREARQWMDASRRPVALVVRKGLLDRSGWHAKERE